MGKGFVTVKGKKHYIEDSALHLNNLGIDEIDEISGLENLSNLQILDLSGKWIKEISGL